MYQFEWGDVTRFMDEETAAPSTRSRLSADLVSGVMSLCWSEHGLECAPPFCYSSSTLLMKRSDQKFSRFFYGIVMNPNLMGLLNS